jgi:hypothetical protein
VLVGRNESAKSEGLPSGNPLVMAAIAPENTICVPYQTEEPSSGKVRVAYNLPSSLMSALEDNDVSEAAHALDAKLIALAEKVSGAKA